jgi:hypothetical protein
MNLGARRGLWKNHKTDQGGHIFDFVAVHFLGLNKAIDDFPGVLDHTAALLGLSAEDATFPKIDPAQRRRKEQYRKQQDEEERAKKQEEVRQVQKRVKPIPGTPAAAYLRKREIDPDSLDGVAWYLPPFVSTLPYRQHGHLVFFVTDAEQRVTAGKHIPLQPDGSGVLARKNGKSSKIKRSFGRTKGASLKLPGSSTTPLIVAEGPETALAIWQATGYETWSVLDVGGFLNFAPPDGRSLILCPDQDAPDSPAAKTFAKAVERLRGMGKAVAIARAPEPAGSKNDFNDTLMRVGPEPIKCAIQSATAELAPQAPSRDSHGRYTGPAPTISRSAAPAATYETPEAAATRIHDLVDEFFRHACSHSQRGAGGDQVPRTLSIAASPGAGKSRITFDALAKIDLKALGGDIELFVPTLQLADEVAATLAERHVEAKVLRGRSAIDPVTSTAMCRRAELAEAIAKKGLSVEQSLCRSCPFKQDCAYRRQWADLPHQPVVRIQTTQALFIPSRGARRNRAMRIVDEAFWQHALQTVDIPVDKICRARSDDHAWADDDLKGSRQMAATVLAHTDDDVCALPADLSAETCVRFAEAERARAHLRVAANSSDAEVRAALAHRAEDIRMAVSLARLWDVLGDCCQRGLVRSQRVHLARPNGREVLRVSMSRGLPQDCPTLLLDATADPAILGRFATNVEHHDVVVRPNAVVTQVGDKTFSKMALAGSSALRREALDFVRLKVTEDRRRPDGPRGVLVVASKSIVLEYFAAAGRDPTQVRSGDSLDGAKWSWFGPATVGTNQFRDFGTVIILGREEPPLAAIEDQARSLFGDASEALQFVGCDQGANYPEVDCSIPLSGGTRRTVLVRSHPDPRVRAVQAQCREAATIQSIGRIRATRAQEPKQIYILSKVPVPGLLVDRLATWDEVRPNRLVSALSEVALGGGLLRLSAQGLVEDAPDAFNSKAAAGSWLQREGRGHIKNLRTGNKSPNDGAKVFAPRFGELRLPGQRGRATPVVIVAPGDPAALVHARFGAGAVLSLDEASGAEVETASLNGERDRVPLRAPVRTPVKRLLVGSVAQGSWEALQLRQPPRHLFQILRRDCRASVSVLEHVGPSHRRAALGEARATACLGFSVSEGDGTAPDRAPPRLPERARPPPTWEPPIGCRARAPPVRPLHPCSIVQLT